MKIMHLADLHLGKRINGYALTEDQTYILKDILEIADKEDVDVCLIAGDIYDRSIPPVDAVKLLNDFLRALTERHIKVCMISGNHDSAERIAFAGDLLKESGVFVSVPYEGKVRTAVIEDAYGEVCFYLLPFIKPGHVRSAFGNEKIRTYTEAVRAAIEEMKIDRDKRNVLLSHQFVTGSLVSDSEEISIGGLDNVDGEVYRGFDYVALGHLHRAQKALDETIRYAGTPLKYAFTENDKTVTIVEMKNKGEVSYHQVKLHPKRQMRVLEGMFDALVAESQNAEQSCEDYLKVILNDEEDVPDAFHRLKAVYPNLMQMIYRNTRTEKESSFAEETIERRLSPVEYARDLYAEQNNKEMTEGQKKILERLIEEVRA